MVWSVSGAEGRDLENVSLAKSVEKASYMIAWEADLQEDWDLDVWYKALFRS